MSLTLDEKIKELEAKKEEIEKECDEKLCAIDDLISDLQKVECKECEGLGTYQFRDYIDKCPNCNGTGFEREEN
jgi:DNA repair exonuclease SbcCD ATPase subunit